MTLHAATTPNQVIHLTPEQYQAAEAGLYRAEQSSERTGAVMLPGAVLDIDTSGGGARVITDLTHTPNRENGDPFRRFSGQMADNERTGVDVSVQLRRRNHAARAISWLAGRGNLPYKAEISETNNPKLKLFPPTRI